MPEVPLPTPVCGRGQPHLLVVNGGGGRGRMKSEGGRVGGE